VLVTRHHLRGLHPSLRRKSSRLTSSIPPSSERVARRRPFIYGLAAACTVVVCSSAAPRSSLGLG